MQPALPPPMMSRSASKESVPIKKFSEAGDQVQNRKETLV
jgi:hypothetical protein